MSKNLYFIKNNTGDHKAFSLFEVMFALGIIVFVSMLSLTLMKSIPNFRLETNTTKYCEMIDSAVTSAAAALGKQSVKDVELSELVPYLRCTLADDNASITMNDHSVITGGGESYTVTFTSGATQTYTVTNNHGLDCVINGTAN